MTAPLRGTWSGAINIPPRTYRCGYCDRDSGSKVGYCIPPEVGFAAFIYICGACNRPLFFEQTVQTPPSSMGQPLARLPVGGVAALYEEVRRAASAGAYTCAVISARTLVAHVAVEKGADTGLSFVRYIDYLEKNQHTTASMGDWIEHLRKQGNVAAHDLKIISREECVKTLKFVRTLLHLVYELPGDLAD